MLGLMAGLPGARSFRQRLSDAKQLASGDPTILYQAAQAVLGADAFTRSSGM
jgi:tRNA-dihydrouridine synthase A